MPVVKPVGQGFQMLKIMFTPLLDIVLVKPNKHAIFWRNDSGVLVGDGWDPWCFETIGFQSMDTNDNKLGLIQD